MATGATGQLGLALPVQGELSGTWGDTVNNGITQYTNIAIAATLTLTGDGAVTLANTTGDASASNITSTLAGAGTVTAQFAMVRVSGTTTTKVVTGPSYSKSYIIDNASSFGVTFKASGQTGVLISPGEKVGVYYNGTDYVKIGGGGITYGAVKTTTYTAVSNDGVLTNTTGGAFTVNLPATPSTGTQVFIADSAGTWATNNLTIGRNGSTIAGSATDLVCDINSVSIQCIYDGTTWDIFAQIGANDTAVVTLNGTQTLTNKTLTSPTITGTGAIAAATVTLSGNLTLSGGTANGVTYLNGSKVLTSGSALTFDGNTFVSSRSTDGLLTRFAGASYGLTINSDVGSGIRIEATDPTGAASWQPLIFNATNQIFKISNTEGMRLTSTGLGIGTSSPSSKLDVSGSGVIATLTGTGVTNYLKMTNTGQTSANGFQIQTVNEDAYITNYSTAGTIIFATNGSSNNDMTLDASGNLGIGTTSPAVRVHAYSTTTMGQLTVDGAGPVKTGINFASGGTVYGQIYFDNNAPYDMSVLQQYTTGSLRFGTNNTERVRIDSSGNLLVGLTAQVGSGTICTVNSATKNGIVVKDSASGSALYSGLDTSNSSVFIVQGSGNVQNANNSYGAISDVKLKENIVDASPKLANLMQVKVRNYNLIGETTKQIGVVAQELETIFPAMVEETPDKDAEGNSLGTTTKSVKYSIFVPMLIKAIQEQQTLITQLQTDVATLKGN